MQDQAKPFIEHLEDLRRLVLRSVAAALIGMVLSAIFLKEIFTFLQAPLVRVVTERGLEMDRFLQTLAPIDPLTLALQATLFTGLIVAAPALLYFLGQFLLPALTPSERRMLLPAFLVGGGLFVVGLCFCYILVLPAAIGFFIEFNAWLGWSAEWTVQNYLVFALQMLLAFGISFEMPLVIVILAKLGIVNTGMLRTYRRHTIVGLLVFAACVTPTGDPFSLSLLFGPMYILYEISILLAARIEAKREAEEE